MSVMRFRDLSKLSAELVMKQVGSLHTAGTAASNNRKIVAFVLIVHFDNWRHSVSIIIHHFKKCFCLNFMLRVL